MAISRNGDLSKMNLIQDLTHNTPTSVYRPMKGRFFMKKFKENRIRYKNVLRYKEVQ